MHGAVETAGDDNHVEYQRILKILLEEMPLKQAVSIATKITGAKRNLLYELAVRYKA